MKITRSAVVVQRPLLQIFRKPLSQVFLRRHLPTLGAAQDKFDCPIKQLFHRLNGSASGTTTTKKKAAHSSTAIRPTPARFAGYALLIAFLFLVFQAAGQSVTAEPAETVQIRSYVRNDGKVVRAYARAVPGTGTAPRSAFPRLTANRSA
jgi:hypothetical protein